MQTIQQPIWRNYVADVRSDAVDISSPEVAVYAAENDLTMDEALDGYREDCCFFDQTLQHWFPYEDGEEVDGIYHHVDAPFIGDEDRYFDYGFIR